MPNATVTAVKEAVKQNTNPSPKKPRSFRWLWIIGAVLVATAFVCARLLLDPPQTPAETEEPTATESKTEPWSDPLLPAWIDVQLIDVDGESRRGVKLEAVRDIAIHYVANPGTTAQQNRNYYNNPDSSVSSHFLIGLEGEVILCVPLDEKSSATNERNRDTVSVEICHPDATGRFTEKTEEALVRLLAYLLDRFQLEEENIIRHYDVTGKLCPLYYVEDPQAFADLKERVALARKGGSL